MLSSAGKYTLKKGKVVVKPETAVVAGDWNTKDASLLELNFATQLNGQNSSEYTLELKDFKDGTVRANALGTTEEKFNSGDTLDPELSANYAKEEKKANDQYTKVRLFFNEPMDEATLTDAKNFTFASYYNGKEVKTNVRGENVKVAFTIENSAKELVIETTDDSVYFDGNITLLGVKDKAGNPLKTTKATATDGVSSQTLTNTQLVQDDDELRVRGKFANEIRTFNTGVFQLTYDTNKAYSLSFNRQDGEWYYFDIESGNKIQKDAKVGTHVLKMEVVSGKAAQAKDVYGNDAVNASDSVVDKVKPVLDADTKPFVAADEKNFVFTFTEKMVATNAVATIKKVQSDGTEVGVAHGTIAVGGTGDKQLSIPATDSAKWGGATYKITLTAQDDNGNLTTTAEKSIKLDADATAPKITGIAFANSGDWKNYANAAVTIQIKFDEPVTAGTDYGKFSFELYADKSQSASVTVAGASGILSQDKKTLTVTTAAVTADLSGDNAKIVLTTSTGSGVKDIAGNDLNITVTTTNLEK